jgi:hypothetical protein
VNKILLEGASSLFGSKEENNAVLIRFQTGTRVDSNFDYLLSKILLCVLKE